MTRGQARRRFLEFLRRAPEHGMQVCHVKTGHRSFDVEFSFDASLPPERIEDLIREYHRRLLTYSRAMGLPSPGVLLSGDPPIIASLLLDLTDSSRKEPT